MRSCLSCSIRGKVDPTGGRTTDWWLKVSNTGVCPLYVVRLSTPIRNGALVRNVIRAGDIIDVPQAGADLYAVWKRVKTEPTPAPTLPQTGGMLGLIGGMGAAVLLTGAGIAFKLRRR